jgi:hypothetical protein
MLQLIPAIAALAEEYVVVRRALSLYRVGSTARVIAKGVTKLGSDPTAVVKPVAYDEVFFYLLGHGLYSAMFASSVKERRDPETVNQIIESVLTSATFRNTPVDVEHRIPAFLTGLGMKIAETDQGIASRLSDLARSQDSKGILVDLIITAANDAIATTAIRVRLTKLGADSDAIAAVLAIFADKDAFSEIKKEMTSLGEDKIDMSLTAVGLIYASFVDYSRTSTFILIGGPEKVIFRTGFLAADIKRPSLQRPNRMQYHSLTVYDKEQATNMLLRLRGYKWNDQKRNYETSYDDLLGSLHSQIEEEMGVNLDVKNKNPTIAAEAASYLEKTNKYAALLAEGQDVLVNALSNEKTFSKAAKIASAVLKRTKLK